MENSVLTKKCAHCGRELSVDNFYVNKKNSSGYDSYCKECMRAISKRAYEKRKADAVGVATSVPSSFKKVYAVPELAEFSNRQLLDEIRARGFRGELRYEYTVKI